VGLLAFGVVSFVVVGFGVVAGDLVVFGLRPWICTRAEAVVRIAEDWRAWGDAPPRPGAIVALDLTAAGRAIGKGAAEDARR
jgi:hypothetical protein